MGLERRGPHQGLGRTAAVWCLLAGLSFALCGIRASAASQKAGPPKSKGSAADSAEFKDLARRATDARTQNRLQEASDLYQKALKLNPRWEEGWWYLGTIYYDANLYSDGVKAFHNLVELDPQYGQAWALLGLCEFETHDYKNALVHLEMGRAKGLGDNTDLLNVVHYHQALLDILANQFETANTLLSVLIQHNVFSNDVKMAMGETLLRVPLLPSQIDPEKDGLISAAGKVGELIALNDFDEAAKGFQQLIKEYPNTPFVHYAYGTMLTELSQYDKAEQELEEEIKINPGTSMPYMQLAYIYVRLNRYKDALPLAQQAVKLAPDSFGAHYLLGRALLGTDKVIDAIEELTIAKRLGPYSPEVRYNLALALARAKRPREAAAEQAAFQKLSALVQRAEKQSGINNSYRNSSERGELDPHQVENPPSGPPQR
jgi:tetratricopeptide (TPR) repeat protein